jgi:Zn-dependent protease with chaperone function
MLEKGFIRNQENENSKHQKLASIISKTLLYLGAIVLIGSFVYLLVNWGTNDLLIGMLMPFMVTGLGLILVSWLISRAYSKLRR